MTNPKTLLPPSDPAGLASELASAVVAAPLGQPVGCSNFKLRQATRVVSRHYDAVMAAATGLKTSQYSLLSHIDKLGPLQPSELAAHMALEPSTLSRNLQPLIAQGWVLVGPGANQRSRTLSLSEAGRTKRAEAKAAWKAAQLAFNARLGLERVARLHELLDECLVLMADGTAQIDPPLPTS
ncbi:MAG: winged helix-turn-helix transcriptional regulator [Burkholderiales bacterium]|nr:winged helix-turn-helix transcriptional regulator [Burkholderiales bacterium]